VRGLETPAGVELFALMKAARGNEVKAPKDAPQDTVARRDEPATAELELKAQELAHKTGLSYAQAYTRIIDDPKYRRIGRAWRRGQREDWTDCYKRRSCTALHANPC
jgi:predicted DNA-binding transcriptional regulator AlpA